MTAQPTEPAPALPRRQLEAIDPDSSAGRQISAGLGELFDDVVDRLRREGKPIPEYLTP